MRTWPTQLPNVQVRTCQRCYSNADINCKTSLPDIVQRSHLTHHWGRSAADSSVTLDFWYGISGMGAA